MCVYAYEVVESYFVGAAKLDGLITEVHDGDSVALANLQQTCLVDIDAPELSQAFGKDSRTSLREMCLLKQRYRRAP